uniref:Reverse transcriptase domain-containing protein n=1 Tax=Anabas testudineus TaxID=64144 RepID=A0AAQ6IEF8_ANATE
MTSYTFTVHVLFPRFRVIRNSCDNVLAQNGYSLYSFVRSYADRHIDHNILLHRLEIESRKPEWFNAIGRFSCTRYDDLHAQQAAMVRAVLGPILFTLYMSPLGNIIRKHSINFHCYADDSQLYLSMKPGETNQLVKLQECLKDIKAWMTSNFLLLNPDKTEVILFGPKNLRDTMSKHILTIDDLVLASIVFPPLCLPLSLCTFLQVSSAWSCTSPESSSSAQCS